MAETSYLMYKEKPLVRCGNKIYYGNMADGYVIEMTLHELKEDHKLQMSNRITVRLICTCKDCPPQNMIISKGEKYNLADALELGEIWLGRKLSEMK